MTSAARTAVFRKRRVRHTVAGGLFFYKPSRQLRSAVLCSRQPQEDAYAG